MEKRKVYVMGEPDFSDLMALSGISFEDFQTRLERTVLRKDFNRKVMATMQDFARENGLEAEVNFSDAVIDVFGITFKCTDRFKTALQRESLPYIGPFIYTEMKTTSPHPQI